MLQKQYRNRYACVLGTMVVLTAVVACVRQEAEPEGPEKVTRGLIISARQQTEKTGTRTILVDGESIHWLPADEISVFSAGETAKFTSMNAQTAASARFQGEISVYKGLSGNDAYIWALYPYDANAAYADGRITTSLPAAQTAVADSFDDDLMAGIGRSLNPFIHEGKTTFQSMTSSGQSTDGILVNQNGIVNTATLSKKVPSTESQTGSSGARVLEMDFEQVTSGIRFSLKKPDIEAVTLSSNGGEALAGTYTVGLDNNGAPVIGTITNPSASITLTPPSGETFRTGVWYYFITLPGTFAQGLTFTLYSGSKTGVREYNTRMVLRSGAFKRSTEMDKDVEMEEQEVEVQVAGPDTWVATDQLGRTLPTDVRAKRTDRQVMMFYWTWHTESHADYPTIVDISGVQGYQGGAYINDYNAPVWGQNHGHDPCFWGTPLFGYYRTTDRWVLRKHAEMLADAGVDAVIFDCTNGTFQWKDATEALMEVWTQAQQDGVNVPKICFHLPFAGAGTSLATDSHTALRNLWRWIYGAGRYQNLWYYVDGKPFVMVYSNVLTSDATDQAIKNFFTFRAGQGDYVTGDQGGQWGWLQVAPQHLFNNEEMPVGVAQNACDLSQGHCYAFNAPGTYGRSYTRAAGHSQVTSNSYIQGYNFQEQWDYALAADPKYVFVTGWNEWTANRQDSWPSGQPWPAYANAFPDQYDSERSRDIEPTQIWGDHGDNYYYQLIQNIRRYKGVDSRYPNVSKRITMDMDGNFDDWGKVSPDFKHYGGNVMHRNHRYQSTRTDLVYTNTTGRNDFVDARVARDRDYIYFYVETASAITARTDAKWMRLFINIDRDNTTGWKGYDFCLNYRNPASDTQGYVSRCSGTSWRWTDAGTFDYALRGNRMEIRVPRSLLGSSASGALDFEFKWSDNMQDDGKILDFYVNGDCAPGGRFNFHYKDK